MPRRLSILGLLVWMWLVPLLSPLEAQTGNDPAQRTPTEGPLRFRRVFAPAERVQDWPTGSVRHVPVDGQEFERLIKAAQEAADGGPAAAALNSARYIAQYDGEEQLEGTLTWEVEHRGKGQVTFPLKRLGLALGLLRWSNSPDPVHLGLDQDGQAVLLVDRSGVITGSWSLHGRRDGDGQLGFRFEVPLAVASDLRLTVPTDVLPSTSQGLLELNDERGDAREYRVLLGGAGTTTIRLPLQEKNSANRPPVLMRTSSVYNLSARGLDLSTVWKLDVHQTQIQRLELQLDPGLQLVAARLGETDVPFRTTVLAGEQGESVVLDLVDPLAGWDRPLRLTAIGPLPLEQTTTLPRIRTSDISWQEGTCNVVVHEPLLSRRFFLRDARQTKYSQLPEPNRGESFDVQLFSDAATIEIDLTRERSLLKLATGIDLELGDGTATAEVITDARLSMGQQAKFSADLAPDWIIDDVVSVPREALASWHIDSAEANPQLFIRLARSLSADSAIKFNIHAHRTAIGDPRVWQARELAVLKFHHVESAETFVAMRPKSSLALALNDVENLVPIDTNQLSSAQLALFPTPLPAPIYRFDPDASRFTATVSDELPAYAAKIVNTVRIDADRVEERYVIRCQPDEEPVRRISLAFSEPRAVVPQFRLHGEGEGALAARRLTPDEQAERRVPSAAEAWEIEFTDAQRTPFEIEANRQSVCAASMPIALLSLPAATQQQGQVTIAAATDVGLSLHTEGVSALPSGGEALSPSTRASYQYTPGDTAATIRILRNKSALVPAAAAYVRHALVESRYDAAGRGWHVATYELNNTGKSHLELTLPREAELSRVWIDGHAENAKKLDSPSPQIRVALPSDQTSTTVIVEYRCDRGSLASGGSIGAPLLQADLPVLLNDWLLWIPADWCLLEVTGGNAQPAAVAPTWSQRLFGPGGRPHSVTPTDILSRAGWRSVRDRLTSTAAGPSVEVARSIAARIADGSSQGPRDWGELLADAEDAAKRAGLSLVVDAHGLTEARLGPRSRLSGNTVGSPESSRQSPLAQAGLVLLRHSGTLTVTTRRTAQLFRDELEWIVPEVLAAPQAGELQRVLETGSSKNRFVTAKDWTAHGANFDPVPALPLNLGGDGRAAVSFLISGNGTEPLSVRIAHVPTLSSWRFAACLFVLLGCLAFAHRGRWLLALLIASAAVALVAPPLLAPWATGALGGTALAIFGRLLLGNTARRREEASSAATSAYRRAAVVTCLSLAAAGFSVLSVPATAQQTKPNSAEENPDGIYRVFIPVDDDEQPTDDKYQVPEQLYDELRSRLAKQEGRKEGWLIRSAVYQLSLQRADALSDALVPSDVAVRFELEVFSPDTLCRLPLMGVRPGPKIRQHGRETELEWDIDEDGFVCRFREAGHYQLELSLRTQRGEASGGTLDMPIPAVPRSALEVQLPASVPSVEVLSAYGATVASADGRQLRADLGSAERLTLRWARPRLGRASPSGGEADQWLWLQVQPASVVLHTRLDIRGMKAPLTELRLAIDPRLRALPVVDRSGTVASVQAVPGDPQTVRVELARPVVDRVTIPVSFLLTGSSGIGQLSLPRVVPQGIKVKSRVLAVSVEPALQFESPPAAPEAVVSVTDFLASWGGAPTAPQAVVKLDADQHWSMAVRPREGNTTIKQRLGVSIGDGRSHVQWEAQMIPSEGQLNQAGYVLQYRLTAPPSLELETVSLVQDGIERISRWVRDEEGLLTLFLAGPTSGKVRIALRGWMNTPQQGEWELPRIDIDALGRRDTTVQIWRQASVLVALPTQYGLVDSERSRDSDEASLPGRLIAAFVAGQDTFRTPLRIMRNLPRARSTLTTTVTRDDQHASGQIEYRTTVEDGCLDTVTFNLPASWSGPFEANPAAALEVISGPTGARQLRLRPKAPLEGDFRVLVTSPLQIAPGEKLLPPRLVAADGEDVVSAISLPAKWGNDRAVWQTTGMQPVSATGAELPHVKTDATEFRIIDAQAAAWLSVDSGGPEVAESRADVSMICQPQAPRRGQVIFTIGESTTADCRLNIPARTKILEIRQQGLVITPPPDGDGWLIKLTRQIEQQTIQVIFENAPDESSFTTSCTLETPWLTGIDIAETSWSLYQLGDADELTLATSAAKAQLIKPSTVSAPTGLYSAGSSLDVRPPLHFSFAGAARTLTVQRGAWSDRFSTLLRWGAALLLFIVAAAVASSSGTPRSLPPARAVAGLAVFLLGLWSSAWFSPHVLAPLISLVILAWCFWPVIRRAPTRESESQLHHSAKPLARS